MKLHGNNFKLTRNDHLFLRQSKWFVSLLVVSFFQTMNNNNCWLVVFVWKELPWTMQIFLLLAVFDFWNYRDFLLISQAFKPRSCRAFHLTQAKVKYPWVSLGHVEAWNWLVHYNLNRTTPFEMATFDSHFFRVLRVITLSWVAEYIPNFVAIFYKYLFHRSWDLPTKIVVNKIRTDSKCSQSGVRTTKFHREKLSFVQSATRTTKFH